MKFVYVLLITLSLGFSVPIAAGTTGKIAGKATDAETGQPLMGVNIIVEGTSMGAATNADGSYAILNVPPGTYNIRFSMVSYEKVTIKGVVVEIDLTSVVNADLHTTTLTVGEVVVSAHQPVVVKDVANSVLNIKTEDIETLPVHTITEVLKLQAGIQQGSSGILVRGGGANQTIYLVDGFSLNDERSNIPYSALSLASAKNIQIQTGGFNAEYGNVRSGIVNVITKDGDRDRYSATINVSYASPQQKHFGISPYNVNSYYNRPYTDPTVCWTGTNNGAWDQYTKESYPSFQGWNAIALKTLQDDNPANDLTPLGAKKLWEWQRRRTGDINKPDYTIDAGFGGPVPFVGQELGNLRFYLSYFAERDMFVIPLSRDAYTDNHLELKFNSNITPDIKLLVMGIYGEDHSVSPYEWTTTPTGYLMRSQAEVADLLSSTDGMNVLYMPDRYSPSSIYRNVIGISLTHVLSPTTFYDATFQRNENRYKTFQSQLRDTSKIYEPIAGYFVDEAPYGYWGYSTGSIDGVMSMGGWMNLGRDKSVNSTTSLMFNLTSQFDKYNQVKAGFQFYYNDMNISSGTYSPSMSTWTRNLQYHIFPYRLGVYAQDKLEFQGFIANIGARFDYSNPNSDYLELDPYNNLYSAGAGKLITQNSPKQKATSEMYLSPRLGISHPITEDSKLYFNYGHFVSEPSSSYRFLLQQEANGQVDYMGNPNMNYEKTIAYELGYEQNLFNTVLLHLAAYYKDVTHQPGWILYQSINTSVNYYQAASNNYADIRGFEVTLSKVSGGWFKGFINYTYNVVTSGYFDITQYFQDLNKQRAYLLLNPQQSKPVPQPYARANVEFDSPDDFGPVMFGMNPLGGWSLSILANWQSGAHATYNPNNIPGVSNNVQWVDYFGADMRLAKDFRGFGDLLKLNFQLYLDISNVFNFKFLNTTGFVDSYDYQDYLTSLCFPFETGDQNGNDRIGEYRPGNVAYDPLQSNPNNDPEITKANNHRKETKSYINMPNDESMSFLNPRHFSLGIRVNF
ncbi:MAG: TonB-dependent receptor [Ignavibacteriales bacterium]|nr:TonB-dependent receptor [Ignavibacteriales bacterium]